MTIEKKALKKNFFLIEMKRKVRKIIEEKKQNKKVKRKVLPSVSNNNEVYLI